ncbi:hypothetical protein T08_3510 [Trichinella sp. T8]|nr:hypothetical protein T08_3510 [Trichinella sp. T8]
MRIFYLWVDVKKVWPSKGKVRALLRIQQKSLLPCEAESQKLNFVHRANLPPLCTLRLR